MSFKLIFAITCMFSAAGFYTVAIFRERKRGYLTPWIVRRFILGFLSDMIGTSLMFSISGGRFYLSWHSVPGCFALIFMLIHLLWAVFGLCGVWEFQKYFTKCSVYAWVVWMIAFLSGIIMNVF